MRSAQSLAAILCCVALQSCATIFSGSLDETKLIANSARLKLSHSADSTFNVESEPVKRDTVGEWTEYSFKLDKREDHHVIIARLDSLSYPIRFDRRVNHWWWFPNLITYELGSLVDFGTEAIYHFPDQVIDFSGSSLPPSVSNLDTLAQLDHDLLISGSVGYIFPVYQEPMTFTSWGASLAVKLHRQFWIGAGYTGGSYVESRLGPQEKIYNTSVRIPEFYLHYYPFWGLFTSVGLGRGWLTFERTSGKKEDPLSFSSTMYTLGFGLGLNWHGLVLEWRKFVGLSRIDTPFEDKKSILLDQFKIGFGVGFNAH